MVESRHQSDCAIVALANLHDVSYDEILLRFPRALDPREGLAGIRGLNEEEIKSTAPTGYEWYCTYATVGIKFGDLRGLVLKCQPGGLWHICAFKNLEVHDPAASGGRVSLLDWKPYEIWQLIKSNDI